MFFFVFLVAAVAASPFQHQRDDVVYYSAIDLPSLTLPSYNQYVCLAQNNSIVFINTFSKEYGGIVDPVAADNYHWAKQVGLSTEFYFEPYLSENRTLVEMFEDVWNRLYSRKVPVRSMWISVVDPTQWSTTITENIANIRSVFNRAALYGVTFGVKTNKADWQAITGGYSQFSHLHLWFMGTPSSTGGQSTPTYDDFSTFGGWRWPAAKQFAWRQLECNVVVNKDVYTA